MASEAVEEAQVPLGKFFQYFTICIVIGCYGRSTGSAGAGGGEEEAKSNTAI